MSVRVPDTGPMDQDVAGVEQRWAVVNRRGPYVLLLVGAVLAVPTAGMVGMGPGDWYAVGGLVAAGLALQVWWGTVADTPIGPSGTSVCYYSVRWVIAFALTWINP